MGAQVNIPTDQLADFCQRHQIRKLSLFGSALSDDFHPDSDVDLLVEFEPEARVGFFQFVDLQDRLSDLLGRSVDLNTPMSLSRHFRQKVVALAEVLYEHAG